jgi:hypothetical protein
LDHADDALNGTSDCAAYKLKPPFTLRIVNVSTAPRPVADEVMLIRDCPADAHRWFRENRGGRDAVVELEIAQALYTLVPPCLHGASLPKRSP